MSCDCTQLVGLCDTYFMILLFLSNVVHILWFHWHCPVSPSLFYGCTSYLWDTCHLVEVHVFQWYLPQRTLLQLFTPSESVLSFWFKVVKILPELFESEPKAYPKHQRERWTNISYKQQNYRWYLMTWNICVHDPRYIICKCVYAFNKSIKTFPLEFLLSFVIHCTSTPTVQIHLTPPFLFTVVKAVHPK